MKSDQSFVRELTKSRMTMVLQQPFWGALALRLKMVVTDRVPTAATDGVHLFCNPDFMKSVTPEQRVGIMAHEVAHCAFGHLWRIPKLVPLDRMRANIAADYAINPLLLQQGFKLPEGCLDDAKWHGKSMEYIYSRLQSPAGKGKGKKGDGPESSRGAASGGEDCLEPHRGDEKSKDGTSSVSGALLEQEWEAAVREAAETCRRQGTLPAGMDRFITAGAKPRTDALAEILKFVALQSRDDYSWRRPNRQYLPANLYMPSLHNERVGVIAVGVDTSGSIDHVLLKKFAGWIQAILDDFLPEKIVVNYCDAAVHGVQEFEPGDVVALNAKGGGGTDFRPSIAKAAECEPIAMIYLTDLYGSFPEEAPEFPVCWITPTQDATVPFGDVIWVE